MPLTVRITADPPGAEFVEPADDRGRVALLRVPRWGLDPLAAAIEARYGGDGDGTRLERAVAALATAGELTCGVPRRPARRP